MERRSLVRTFRQRYLFNVLRRLEYSTYTTMPIWMAVSGAMILPTYLEGPSAKDELVRLVSRGGACAWKKTGEFFGNVATAMGKAGWVQDLVRGALKIIAPGEAQQYIDSQRALMVIDQRALQQFQLEIAGIPRGVPDAAIPPAQRFLGATAADIIAQGIQTVMKISSDAGKEEARKQVSGYIQDLASANVEMVASAAGEYAPTLSAEMREFRGEYAKSLGKCVTESTAYLSETTARQIAESRGREKDYALGMTFVMYFFSFLMIASLLGAVVDTVQEYRAGANVYEGAPVGRVVQAVYRMLVGGPKVKAKAKSPRTSPRPSASSRIEELDFRFGVARRRGGRGRRRRSRT